jgi:hypothetical protein
VRFKILVVTVQLDDFKNVANPGHGNETTPCLVNHDEGRGEHGTRGMQTDREWRPEMQQRAGAHEGLAIMRPPLRESNILQLGI